MKQASAQGGARVSFALIMLGCLELTGDHPQLVDRVIPLALTVNRRTEPGEFRLGGQLERSSPSCVIGRNPVRGDGTLGSSSLPPEVP